MTAMDLPAEVWTQIFDLAADEDLLLQPELPTSLDDYSWTKQVTGQWRIRSPAQSMHHLQFHSYATKKAIVRTCKRWRKLGSEFLFRCLYFNDPSRLVMLHHILQSSASSASTISSSLGWWTRRIHIAQYHPVPHKSTSRADLDTAIVSIIQYCPNLEIFIVERSLGNIFGSVADRIAQCGGRESLKTISWNVPGESIAKVIWALNVLPNITILHVDIDVPTPSSQEYAHLGSATDLPVDLPHLEHLSMKGYVEEFLEQVTSWRMPNLTRFALASGNSVSDHPDVVSFLKEHGVNLVLLDLNSAPTLNVAAILDLCPNLQTFAFNADWNLPLDAPPPHMTAGSGSTPPRRCTKLTNRPHMNIETIGLHGLSTAFLSSPPNPSGSTASSSSSNNPSSSSSSNMTSHLLSLAHHSPARTPSTLLPGLSARTRRMNDLNIASLTRVNFPRLRSVRALNKDMLMDLNEANGPSEGDGGYERWAWWWDWFVVRQGVRLEDCTGGLLGTLPEDEEEDESEEESSDEDEEEGEAVSVNGSSEEEEGSEDDDDEESDSDESGEEEDIRAREDEAYRKYWEGRQAPPLPAGNGRVNELTRLLQEVRAHNATRDEALIARHRPHI